MAVQPKDKGGRPLEADDERKRRDERRARERFGIVMLEPHEELIDDETFAEMHDRMARSCAGSAAAPEEADPSGESLADAEEIEELLLEEVVAPPPGRSGARGRGRERPADAAEVASLEGQLPGAKDREEVADLTLRIARYYSEAAALFVVNRGMVSGLMGSGQGLEDRLVGIVMPIEQEPLFSMPVEARRPVRCREPRAAIDRRVLQAMGRREASEHVVLPIAIGHRVVNLLYVDNGEARLPETSIAALGMLCGGVGKVYERLILARKSAGRPPRERRRRDRRGGRLGRRADDRE